ncbi:phosphoadenosine phosphosulfate reductase family protein [Chryseobacterium sp. Ch-15]|uniref:Phosphoadenosine phosphosulfate reductase family protein n=1 Tax=Chryseobacterium muglaense TaxID=2893752 RepID=A0A9Q3US30_9FLAO|nr:phosphoadenosine phosphosulfate reductase family protein [Chryseobacterium muglaense]MBD3904466.1 phosphoadenosine phosphosulfate reductase family protein [Chryseobacterium muglaense]MCC9032715.1 phosphoadenosine phosphosulfate reductase family protein [Chryseobacterium muglaense]MCM2554228.1 phosphoadenosine phosphosulfate reductase family protein [Chryseobacterium muglaense]
MKVLEHAKLVISTVREKTDKCILFYSAGKDSIALLDLLSKEFKEVVCVFMYFVKDLEHINRFIEFSKKKYDNVTFEEVPHWTLTKIHKYGLFCQPRKIRQLKFADTINAVKIRTGLKYAFIGEKKADNMARNIKLRQYDLEAISTTNNVYPLSLWKDVDVIDYIKRNNLPQPIKYGNKRSNGVNFDIDVYVYLRKFYPNDLKKILQAYPLSEKLLIDYDEKN